jgi:Fusaric acid resistance protein-like
MSRWRPSLVSLQPGMAWPGLVTRQQVVLAAKAAVAPGLAWVAALAADPHSRPYFAPLAAVLVVQPTVYDSLSRAFQRVAGVVAGVAAALAVSHFLAPSAWSIGIIIFAGLLLGWAVRLGPQGAVQVPVSALLVFLIGRATPGYGGSWPRSAARSTQQNASPPDRRGQSSAYGILSAAAAATSSATGSVTCQSRFRRCEPITPAKHAIAPTGRTGAARTRTYPEATPAPQAHPDLRRSG